MIGYVEAPKAWWLTHGMARVAGVSLPRAVTEGWLKRSELARLVSRCQGCACAETCIDWVAHACKDQALPEFCPNKHEIEALAHP
ncbi:hypothetical protein SAMN04488103_103250 [Gemmobacter aquatilis]|uniref:DUF6455 domain-containing protein n=1 Tax=Gemmobacter aquatilis TaxID=933059 RepID=A0A1H8EAR4_9RHOB|nr:DUF6455 family protein [Gemmobacter aquatilis]SEN15848.1 hypothetical protein SAMN04488103_103250 [Gemmobacter aquatilis]